LYANAPIVTVEIIEALTELADQKDWAEGFVQFMRAFIDKSDDHPYTAYFFDIFFSEPE
jgi:hypothetical protein